MPGEIISECRARSNRNGGRHHRGFAGDFPRNPHPIARKFVRSAGDAGAGARLLAAGAALRQKVAWLATPQPDTRDFLARALAKELLIAVTGDLDRFECAEITGSL